MIGNVDKIITEYLSQNKRLVIPDFGALLRKETGEVVLVEFLKKDDHVLQGLISYELGLSDADTQSFMKDLVARIRKNAVAGGHVVEGLGVIVKNREGLYELAYDPSAGTPQESAAADTDIPQAVPEEKATIVPAPQIDVPAVSEAPEHGPHGAPSENSGVPHAEGEDAVKDLRYQKPARPADYRKKKRTDAIMIIAIIAAVIAIGAMIFGLMTDDDPAGNIKPVTPVQQEEPGAVQDSVVLEQNT